MLDRLLKLIGLVRVSRLFEKQDYALYRGCNPLDGNWTSGGMMRQELTKALGIYGQGVTDIYFDIPIDDVAKIRITKLATAGDIRAATKILAKYDRKLQ